MVIVMRANTIPPKSSATDSTTSDHANQVTAPTDSSVLLVCRFPVNNMRLR